MYTTFGYKGQSIDCCDHEHETRDDAQRCLAAHQNEMRKVGKVSNRQIIEVESLDQMYDEVI